MNDDEGFEVGNAGVSWETPDAVLFAVDGYGAKWIPKSQIHDNSEVWKRGQAPGTLVVKTWFAEKEGWI
jgi:hypothetical protein